MCPSLSPTLNLCRRLFLLQNINNSCGTKNWIGANGSPCCLCVHANMLIWAGEVALLSLVKPLQMQALLDSTERGKYYNNTSKSALNYSITTSLHQNLLSIWMSIVQSSLHSAVNTDSIHSSSPSHPIPTLIAFLFQLLSQLAYSILLVLPSCALLHFFLSPNT